MRNMPRKGCIGRSDYGWGVCDRVVREGDWESEMDGWMGGWVWNEEYVK